MRPFSARQVLRRELLSFAKGCDPVRRNSTAQTQTTCSHEQLTGMVHNDLQLYLRFYWPKQTDKVDSWDQTLTMGLVQGAHRPENVNCPSEVVPSGAFGFGYPPQSFKVPQWVGVGVAPNQIRALVG